MIAFALEFLLEYLKKHITDVADVQNTTINETVKSSLANIAIAGDDAANIDDGIVITLVNIEEEFAKKNYPVSRRENAVGQIEYKNPPIFLNLYVLFSSKVSSGANYLDSLKRISKVIACFQAKNTFTVPNTAITLGEYSNKSFSKNLRLQLELYSMTFEQLNHLWGTLGGKQYPSVMYKVRLIEIEKDIKQGRGKLIEEVTLKTTTS